MKGEIDGTEYTLANIYYLNKNTIQYLRWTKGKLMEFKGGKIIVAGDFNFVMNPDLDVSSSVGRGEEYQWRLIKKTLYQSQLIDIWRI